MSESAELSPDTGAPSTAEDWSEQPIPTGELAELFQSLDKAARARRLYHSNNPMYQSFIDAACSAVERLWENVSSLRVGVEENAFVCFDERHTAGEGRESLSFMFYKDGIRVLTMLPGFEEEVEDFLQVVNEARQLDQNSADDMVTLLWEREFTSFQYSYVDMLAEGLQVPDAGTLPGGELDVNLLRADLESRVDEVLAPQVAQGTPPVAATVSPGQFVETLYFLEPHELEALETAVEEEWQRDTKGAVLDALFDRVEDPIPERQSEILHILRQLLPVFLSRGDMHSSARVLSETKELIDSGLLQGDQKAAVEDMRAEINRPDVLGELLRALTEGLIDPHDRDLSIFLANLGPDSLPLLIRAAETADAAPLKERLRVAIEGLAERHQAVLLELISAEDELVALGATRLAGKLNIGAAAHPIAELFRESEVEARRVAINALVAIRSSSAMSLVEEAIEDDDREVRIAAVRGLGAMRYEPSRSRIEKMIQSRRIAESDLTEQIAFFEAYGEMATTDGVRLLSRLLSGRRLFGRQSHEIRACAAMALGKIATHEAREALQEAAADPHPMVKNAVSKALAGRPID